MWQMGLQPTETLWRDRKCFHDANSNPATSRPREDREELFSLCFQIVRLQTTAPTIFGKG